MIETIKGTVQRIVFASESGFKVLRVKLSSGPVVSVTGEFGPNMVTGVISDFHGQYKTHPKYGPAFRVASYQIAKDVEELASVRLFIDVIAPNIGEYRSACIVTHFGSDIIRVLDEEPHRLSEVEGIGKVSAESLSEAWKQNREKWTELRQEFTLRAFLNALGIRERRVKKILGFFGGGVAAESAIRSNPFVLAELEGFGFSTADFIAKQLGFPEDSPQRLRAFIYHILDIIAPSNGHLYMTADELVKTANVYCQEHNTTFYGVNPLKLDHIEDILEPMREDGLIFIDQGYIYSRRLYEFETGSIGYLSKMITAKSDLILVNNDEVNHFIERYQVENNIALSDRQKEALHHFVDHKVFIVTGSAGSGKTTVLKSVVQAALSMGLSVTCMTPTGISAKKLADTIGYEASTIHRRLGYQGSKWGCGESNKYETDVVILDESSMIGQEVFYRMLAALKSRVHLVMVGDDNQLPSVEAGNVLRELIQSNAVPVVRLDQIFRQDEASDIIKEAHKIKNGDTDLTLFKGEPESDIFFVRNKDLDQIEKLIIRIVQKYKDEKRNFQIITPRNTGPLSVTTLNNTLQEVLNPAKEGLPEIKCKDYLIRKGDRIKIKKNDYELMVFNGDIGKVVDIGGGYVTAMIDERFIPIPVDELDEKVKLAYALSVHSAQGQEYQYVIMPFINQFGKNMLQRNLLYTAITRAKKKVIVLGHGSALERAINNSSVYKRNTRLGERLKRDLDEPKREGDISDLGNNNIKAVGLPEAPGCDLDRPLGDNSTGIQQNDNQGETLGDISDF